MKICNKCGYREKTNWRGSRFDFNAEYIRFEEAKGNSETDHLFHGLKNRENHDPIFDKYYAYYRRGTGGIYLYRVPKEDFKIKRERKKHNEM